MSQSLLLVSLGPIQDFIQQARRMRDLWFGSHLLSELSRAAARAIAERGGQLVFPALDAGDPELSPSNGPWRPDGSPALAVANKILAVVPEGRAEEIAKGARQAAMERLREFGDAVRKKAGGLLAPGTQAVWDEQLESTFEFLATWTSLNLGYAEARRIAESELAGRKNLRGFMPWRHQRGNVPKSSLDGARETVLREPEQRDAHLARKFRITPGEQLDAIGLIKRAGGEPEQFVPVANVALARWILRARQTAALQMRQLAEECGLKDLSRVRRDMEWVKAFPFDAQIFLEGQWPALREELGMPPPWPRDHVQPILKLCGTPSPYVACLVADGDRMGMLLDSLNDAGAHRAVSRALAAFAAKARDIVERQFCGLLIYSGGDDVLAILPVQEALQCAAALEEAFASHIRQMAGAGTPDQPSLSVGVGIGHVLEDLGDLLDLGRRAEKLAKKERNSLAVLFDKRSGGTLEWSRKWPDDPLGKLAGAMAALAAERQEAHVSTKKVYEIARIAREAPAVSPGAESTAWGDILVKEVRRSLARQEGGKGPDPTDVGLPVAGDAGTVGAGIHEWVGMMRIAREIQAACVGKWEVPDA